MSDNNKPKSQFKLRLFSKVETGDSKFSIRQLGYVRTRPDHPNGDSVNVVAIGGRFDDLREALESRTDNGTDVASETATA